MSNSLIWIIGVLVMGGGVYLVYRIYGRISDFLIEAFKKNPNLRKWLLFPAVIFSMVYVLATFDEWKFEYTIIIMLSIYFVLIVPSAIVSLLLEDAAQEKLFFPLSISRKQLRENPQSAINLAFVTFEDKLRKRINKPELFGENLINAAYAKDKHELSFIQLGEDKTAQARNLLASAYSIFRNPRHHKIIEEDLFPPESLIHLINLLCLLVEHSQENVVES